MTRADSERKSASLRGVSELPACHGERWYRATIHRGKGRQVNLGLYSDRWLAAFAYNVAVEALHAGRRPTNEIPSSHQPTADQVRRIVSRVRQRLGIEGPPAPLERRAPSADQLFPLLEIAVVGFWRGQVDAHSADLRRELDMAGRRLVEAAHLLFWNVSAGHPAPQQVLEKMLASRVDRAFRRADLTREILDDVGDDEFRVARWLVYPDTLPGGGGFQDTIGQLYSDRLGPDATRSASTIPTWAAVLGIAPPFSTRRVRDAYRARSKEVHPDTGGDHAEFVRLQAAYEEARRYCATRGT